MATENTLARKWRVIPVMGAVACVSICANLPSVTLGPVPITLQSFAVLTSAALLGPWRGVLAMVLYLLLGLAGAPVFSGGASGWQVVAGPSGGYLLAFPLAALLCGGVVRQLPPRTRGPRWVWLFACGLGSSALLIHPLGIAGLMRALDLPLLQAVMIDLRFWPGDVLKNIALAGVVTGVRAWRS